MRNKPRGGKRLPPPGRGRLPIGASGGRLGNGRAFGFDVVVVVVVVVTFDVRDNGLRLVEICTGRVVAEPPLPPPIAGRFSGGRRRLSNGFPRRRELSVVVVTGSSDASSS